METDDAILFEDLTLKGYRIASVHRGFNLEEAKLVLKKAALLHAVHAVLQEEYPNIFENFKYGKINQRFSFKNSLKMVAWKNDPSLGLMCRHTDAFNTFFITQFDVMLEVVSTWPDNKHYMEKLQRLRNNLLEKGAKTFDPQPNHFNTLIHGDMFVVSSCRFSKFSSFALNIRLTCNELFSFL